MLMNHMRIAPFVLEDFEPISQLFCKVYKETYPFFDDQFFRLERFRDILTHHVLPKCSLLTVKSNEELVGFMAWNNQEIDQLYIKSNFRGKGIGSYLITIAQTQTNHLRLYTLASNEKAIRFYQRRGFEIIHKGIAPDEQVPDVMMQWQRY